MLCPCLFYHLKLPLLLPAEKPQSCHSGELRLCREGSQLSLTEAKGDPRAGAVGFTERLHISRRTPLVLVAI